VLEDLNNGWQVRLEHSGEQVVGEDLDPR
jgi:hypothetical protein